MPKKKAATGVTAHGLPADYSIFLESLKSRIQQAQTKAVLSVNRELIRLYWDIGRLIVERQELEGWGKGIVDRLAADMQKAFPGLGGFSSVNVWRMRSLYVAYRSVPAILSQAVPELRRKKSAKTGPNPVAQKVAQPVTVIAARDLPEVIAGIPWGHNVVLLQKVKDTSKTNRRCRVANQAGAIAARIVERQFAKHRRD